MSTVPKAVFFVKGKGFHRSKLGSFEQALRDACIGKYNLIKVSSILPPNCIEVSKKKGLAQLRDGQVIYTVLSRANSNEYNRIAIASIGVAKPTEQGICGYLAEYHAFGVKPEKVGEFAEDLATEMLATTLNIPFNSEANYDEKQEIFKINSKIIETKNITEYATVRDENEWLTVIAAAVFIV